MPYEKFEDRRLFGKIKVSCKYEDGSVRVWEDDKASVVQKITTIINGYQAQGYILTLRQLHYQLVTRNWIINHDSAYKKLGSILDDMRYSGEIDWDAIEDRGRVPYLPYYVSGIPEAIEDTVNGYRLDLQKEQENYIELWTEKDALSGILRRSTEKFHVQLAVNKGYTSSTAIYNAYTRFVEKIISGQKVYILYFGDHDPSGLDMVRDINERLTFMFENGENYYQLEDHGWVGDYFKIIHIGLTKEQINRYKPPPNPTKLTDSRADKYIQQHGKTCWEVDALNPETLTAIVEENIKKLIDIKQFNKMVQQTLTDVKIMKEKFDIE